MQKTTKVIFVASVLGTGGAEKQWLELIKGMNRDRFQVTLICLYDLGQIGSDIRSLGVKCYHNILKSKFSFGSIMALTRIFRKEDADVIFLMRDPLTVFYGVIASKLAAIKKIVIAVHCTGYFKSVALDLLVDRIFLPFVNNVVCVGSKHRTYLIDREHYPADKLVTIFNGVDAAKYEVKIDKAAKKAELRISADHKVVGIVARLFPTKRHDIFLKAAEIVIAKFPKTTFLIVGEGESQNNIAGMISSMGISKNVLMLGARRDIPEINNILDVAVLSSDPIVETLPMTIIEAMASSVPVVTTDVGSVSDLVVEGETGFMVSPGNYIDMADRIAALIEDEGLAKEMGRKGHALALRKFSNSVMVEGYERLFSG